MTDKPLPRKRSYLRTPAPTRPIPVDFAVLHEQGAGAPQMFAHLTRELARRYAINRGVLIMRRGAAGPFAAVSTWVNGSLRDGLAVNLPPQSSLFEKVAEHGRVYTENFCASFSGNFFERKLLLGDESRSFVVQPLTSDGEVVGLVAYSSDEPTAFAMFEEGAVEDVARAFAAAIRKQRLA
ncbi:MAG TPA: GAF domain-containing protein [candidate division Zixibacteria bacterium]|nr:GAF domain-containing protein [candidate division Zixibacteria bacterium]MDD4916417.1 GAF domain-containing protein [candidate division Zixibacteria bacterium]MDM7972556.1 GAF domain-containing protein [candidate division Zixibacteria bacterium]HOD65658.1 GAF domain-containing protein [candidate division Zixibacteria bacterium]HOZ07038.1 GAF domain-containing protein [candidate division Zixibacteria bacterium]